MRYKIIVTCIFFLQNTLLYGLVEDFTNQIYMFTRPVSNSISIHQASWSDFGYTQQNAGTGLQVYPIYTQSFKQSCCDEQFCDPCKKSSLPAYFLFDHKHELTIRGGSNPSEFLLTPQGYTTQNPQQDEITTKSFKRDILGQWIDHNDIESSAFSVYPKQKQACVVFEFNQHLKNTGISMLELWYISARLPVTYIENNIGLSGDQKALTSLSNKDFKFANFTSASLKSTRVTNAQFMLGTNYLNENDLQIITGMGTTIPLVEENDNKYVFEPIQGFNSHFSLDALGLFQFPIWNKNDSDARVCYFLAFENHFLARSRRLRTFDLKGKPFSRYLKLLDIETNSLIPAMNVLTMRTRVEPFNIFNMTTGFRFKCNKLLTEVGYDLWAHGTEVITVEPECAAAQWQDDRYGIAFINEDGQLAYIENETIIKPLEPGQTGLTASKSTINYVAPPDGVTDCCSNPSKESSLIFTQKNKYIKTQDLDILSAATRSAMVHRAYVSVGFGNKGEKQNLFANLGAYVEIAQNNAALSMWGAWTKFGLTF